MTNKTQSKEDVCKLFIQNELHQKIRNDEDYDDWTYGTEPTYQMPLNKE
jgi:hypothetical protein